jgi:hypothetical protein
VADDQRAQFVSTLGCTVTVRPAPETLGLGAMLSLRVDHPEAVGTVANALSDEREPIQYAEVYLDREDIRSLMKALAIGAR